MTNVFSESRRRESPNHGRSDCSLSMFPLVDHETAQPTALPAEGAARPPGVAACGTCAPSGQNYYFLLSALAT